MWLLENNYAVSNSGFKILKSNENLKKVFISLGVIEYEIELNDEYTLYEIVEAIEKIEDDDSILTREEFIKELRYYLDD